MWTLLNVFGLLVLLQVTWCGPGGDIAISELEEGNTIIYPSEADNDSLPLVDEGEPSEFFLKEVREYFESMKDKNHSRVTKRHTYRGITHGNSIALQTAIRYKWMSCSAPNCYAHDGCPGNFFDSNEFHKRCWGETFRIYRASGPGYVRVGDLIGIYYPRESLWMGCAGSNPDCYKNPCPGSPSSAHGFSNSEKWYHCNGEVYKIYARGKANGDVIHDQDDVTIYFLDGRDWLSWWGGTMHRNPCPGQTRPPTTRKYDRCSGELFKIWKWKYWEV